MGKLVPHIQIAYVFNKDFFQATLVSAVSAILNNGDCKLSFHLLSLEGNENLGAILRAEIEAYNLTVHEYYVDYSAIRNFSIGKFKNSRNAASQKMDQTIFLKLFIPNIIQSPNILYMDSDTIVGNCLKRLYELHRGTAYNLVAEDRSSREKLGDSYLAKYGLINYFNSGVMYLNLEMLREKSFFDQALKLEAEIGEYKNLADQDLFNILLKNDIQFMDKNFNVQSNAKNSEAEIKNELKTFPKSILHFIGPIKPWHLWSSESHKRIWKVYLSKVRTEKIKFQKPQNLSQFILLSQRHYKNGDYKSSSVLSSKIIEELLKSR
ncbi:glycosyltransferase [Alphaproteobacteria bacterium]|nr:glycosyltransferase [Alphaproteobacteria bacterium]